MGIDEVGIDKVGIDEVGRYPFRKLKEEIEELYSANPSAGCFMYYFMLKTKRLW